LLSSHDRKGHGKPRVEYRCPEIKAASGIYGWIWTVSVIISGIPFAVNVSGTIFIYMHMLVVYMDIPAMWTISFIRTGIRFWCVFFIVIFLIMPGWFVIISGAIFIPIIITVLGSVIVRPGQASEHKYQGAHQHCERDYFVFHTHPLFLKV
jgi:hypothetical protein